MKLKVKTCGEGLDSAHQQQFMKQGEKISRLRWFAEKKQTEVAQHHTECLGHSLSFVYLAGWEMEEKGTHSFLF